MALFMTSQNGMLTPQEGITAAEEMFSVYFPFPIHIKGML